MKKSKLILPIFLVLLVLFYFLCTFIVYEGEIRILTQFGKPIRVIENPGIYLRAPYPFNTQIIIDSRLKMLEPKPSEYLTADKKNLILDNSICYCITDPILYLKSVRDDKGLEIRLTDLMSSHTGLLLSKHELNQLINIDPHKIKFASLNDSLTAMMAKDADAFGITVKEAFIKRIMLPDDNKRAVYKRMSAERERIARKYLAEGEEKAQQIRAEADKKYREIIASAQSEATIIKGQADAEAMSVYGSAYSKNAQFYNFIRALDAYEEIFGEKTSIILDDNSEILKVLFGGGR